MASDREILTKYMEIIDSLNYCYAQAQTIDGTLAVSIKNVIPDAIKSAATMSYRIQRDKWDENGGTYEL